MRFSNLFTRSPSPHAPARGVVPRRVAGRGPTVRGARMEPMAQAPELATPAWGTDSELPSELDARVRSLGEW